MSEEAIKTYEVDLSDGRTAEIDGPANATEEELLRALTEQLPPEILNVEKTKNTPLGIMLRRSFLEYREDETAEERGERLGGKISGDEVGTGEGILRAYGQGGGFGWMDELTAEGAAALATLANKYPTHSYDELRDIYLSRERGKLEQFREQSPWTAGGAEFAGALHTGLATPGARLATMPSSTRGKMAAGAGVAAGEGAIYGAGAAENGMLPQAGVTAAVSTPFGAAAPLAGKAVSSIYDRFAGTGAAAKKVGMSRPSFEVLGDVLAADKLGGNVRLPPDAILAEVGPASRNLFDYLGQNPATAAIVRQAVDARAAQSSNLANQALDEGLGRPVGVATTQRQIRQRTSSGRSAAYRAAYAKPIDYASAKGQELEKIIKTRVDADVIAAANKLMRLDGEPPSAQIILRADNTIERLPDVRQLDYIKRGLNERANVEAGQGAMGGTSAVGRAYENLAREVRNLTGDLVPEYNVALKTAQDPIQRVQAMKFGNTVLRPSLTVSEVAETVAGMNKLEKKYAAMGIRSQIDEGIKNVKLAFTDMNMDARESFKLLKDMSSSANREKVQLVIGKKAAKRLFKKLDQAASGFSLKASVAQNSKTLGRKLYDEKFQDAAQSGVAARLRRGEGVAAAREAVATALGRSPDQVRKMVDKEAVEIARIMARQGVDPAKFLAMLTSALKASRGRTGRMESQANWLVSNFLAGIASIPQQ